MKESIAGDVELILYDVIGFIVMMVLDNIQGLRNHTERSKDSFKQEVII